MSSALKDGWVLVTLRSDWSIRMPALRPKANLSDDQGQLYMSAEFIDSNGKWGVKSSTSES
jgi:hypothetical protein